MTRDEQIVEMASLMTEGARPSIEDADRLYDAGYRKSSDIAKEVFEEIEHVLLDKGSPLTVWCAINGPKYAELKKKYTEDTNVKNT